MKKFLLLTSFCVLISVQLIAQSKAQIQFIANSGDKVNITIKTDQKIIVGNNRYYLFIGDQKFYISQQLDKYTIRFTLTTKEFEELSSGDQVYMSYGILLEKKNPTKKQLEKVAQASPKTFFYLGELDKSTKK